MKEIGVTPDPYLSPFLSLLLLLRRLLSGNVSLIEHLEKGNNLFSVTLVSLLVHPSLVVVYQFSQTLIYQKNHADYELKISIAQQTRLR